MQVSLLLCICPTTLLAVKGMGRAYGWLCGWILCQTSQTAFQWYHVVSIRQERQPLSPGQPQHHMPQNSYVSNEATDIHVTSSALRHCACSHKDLPKVGSYRAGRNPLSVVFIISQVLQNTSTYTHCTKAILIPCLKRGKGDRRVDMKDPNRKCIFNISTSSWHQFFLHEAKGFFPFIFLNDWVLLVISPVRLYYVKYLGFETGIHKRRWQYSGFGNTSLFHKEKIVPRVTISTNTENFALYKSLPWKYMQ